MKLSTKVAELTQIIEPAVTACDVSLWGIEFVPQGRRSLLRIYIEACAAVTHQVGGVLDLHDPIAGEYLLEVSSPGLDRAFFSAEQLHDYVGQTISLRLIHAIGQGSDKRRKVTGELVNIDERQLTVKTENDQVNDQLLAIELDNIDKANLVYQF